jgi:acetyltransferase-like isoleucine patch superfamily enzyme
MPRPSSPKCAAPDNARCRGALPFKLGPYEMKKNQFRFPGADVSPGAVIAPTAILGPDAYIGENVIVGDSAIVGADAVICRDALIGRGAQIGADALIGPRAIIPPGAQVPADAVVFDGTSLVTRLSARELRGWVVEAQVALDKFCSSDDDIDALLYGPIESPLDVLAFLNRAQAAFRRASEARAR